MVTVIESSFLIALVARVGGSTRARAARMMGARAMDLSAEVKPANEEDAAAKGANQLRNADGTKLADRSSWFYHRRP